MNIQVEHKPWISQPFDMVAIGCHEDDSGGIAEAIASVPEPLRDLVAEVAADEQFAGKKGTQLSLHSHGCVPAKRLLLLGLGRRRSPAAEMLQEFATAAVRAVKRAKGKRLALIPPRGAGHDELACLAVFAEMGDYSFDTFRSEKEGATALDSVTVFSDGTTFAESDLRRCQHIARAVNLARDLVNQPANIVTPEYLALTARQLAETGGLEYTILDPAAVAERKFNLLHAVGAGSANGPQLIHLTYRPAEVGPETPVIVLVGKGITFDSGGLSIKPASSMDEMKTDMAGAAAVLAVFSQIGALKPSCVVHGIVAAAENMLSGAAYRPGDVIRGYGGKTVEVLNTDAEGRLVLADALSYALELNPTVVIDLATLTGACCVALGNYMAGLFTDDEALSTALGASAARWAEELWRLPLSERLRDQLKSEVADIKNIGERWGGAITAGLFLKFFVEGTRWAHLDIAGPAYTAKQDAFHGAGATGYGVRLLIDFLAHFPSD